MNTKIPPIIIIFVGLIIYGACGLLSLYIESANYIKLLAIIIVLTAFFKSQKNLAVDTSSTLIKVFFYYTIFILIRGSLLGKTPVDAKMSLISFYDIFRYFMVQEHSAMAFVLILMLVIPFNPRELRYYRSITIVCAIICLFCAFVFKDEIFSFDTFGKTQILSPKGEFLLIRQLTRYCFVGLGIVILFCYSIMVFNRKWIDYLLISVLIIYGIAQVAGGGRGGSITALLYILFLVYFITKYTDRSRRSSVLIKILSSAFAVFILYGTWFLLFKSNSAEFLFSRMFANGEFGGELNESTREVFVDALKADFLNHPLAFVIGKGVNGTYYVKGYMRETIEWGYWYLILKGGIVYLLLYVFVLLKSAYLGFFKSNNVISKAMAALCLLCAYSLIPFGLPMVSLDFLLVWHYVRLLNTSAVREMSNEDVKRLIHQYK